MLLPVVPRDTWFCLRFKINLLEVKDPLVSLSLKYKLANFFVSTKICQVASPNM